MDEDLESTIRNEGNRSQYTLGDLFHLTTSIAVGIASVYFVAEVAGFVIGREINNHPHPAVNSVMNSFRMVYGTGLGAWYSFNHWNKKRNSN